LLRYLKKIFYNSVAELRYSLKGFINLPQDILLLKHIKNQAFHSMNL
jgi:hypothetical protein